MRATVLGSVLSVATLGIGFSALFFEDLVLLVVFIVLLTGLAVEVAWLKIVSSWPERWFSLHDTKTREGALSFSKSLYPGKVSRTELLFRKRTSGRIIVSSDLSFLRFVPVAIESRNRDVKVRAEFKTPFSGEYFSREIRIATAGPFGLFSSRFSIPISLNYKVYPKVIEVALSSSKLLGKAGIGETPAEMPGIGTEFYSLRTYREGDDFRRMNWKASARRGELIMNEYAKEVGSAYVVVLDGFAPDYFDRDRLASTFLQISNSLAMLQMPFGLVVHDGKDVLALQKIGNPVNSLQIALEASLGLAAIGEAELPRELATLSSFALKENQRALAQGGYSTLSSISDLGVHGLKSGIVRTDAFRAVLDLAREQDHGPPFVLYVSGMFGAIDQIVELGSEVKNIYRAQFTLVNPCTPWISSRDEEAGCAAYSGWAKNLRMLKGAGIEYVVGDPVGVVLRLLST